MSTAPGTYEAEYRWAQEHRQHPEAISLLNAVALYRACPEPGSLGIAQGAAERVRELISRPAPGEEKSRG